MSSHLGDFPTGATVYVPFHTFGLSGESITITGLATSDIKIYKDGSTTERSSTAGFTLLDTDGIDFDGLTGIHGFSINLADNTDAGFYAAGHEYVVVVSSIVLNTQTVSFVAATFSIERAGGSLALLKDVGYGLSAISGRIPTALNGGKMDSHVNDIAANAITSTSIQDGAITNAKVADDVDVNVKTITAGAITATAIATNAIDADALATDAIAEIANGLLDLANSIETGITLRKWLQANGAFAAGDGHTLDTTPSFDAIGNSGTPRITSVVSSTDRVITLHF